MYTYIIVKNMYVGCIMYSGQSINTNPYEISDQWSYVLYIRDIYPPNYDAVWKKLGVSSSISFLSHDICEIRCQDDMKLLELLLLDMLSNYGKDYLSITYMYFIRKSLDEVIVVPERTHLIRYDKWIQNIKELFW